MAEPLSATLLVAPGCPHCDAMSRLLLERVKRGDLATLEIHNLQQRPELAQQLGVRSVPWFRVGVVELVGDYSGEELDGFIQLNRQPDPLSRFYGWLFRNGQKDEVLRRVRAEPQNLHEMMKLVFVEKTKFVERIGIGAIIEELEGEPMLEIILPDLERMAAMPYHKDRVDAAYYLGLTRSPRARPVLEKLLEDENREVRQEAEDALEQLPAA